MLAVNIIAMTNIAVLFVLLFFRKENALPNKILALCFLLPGLYFVNTVFILAGFEAIIPFTLFFVQAIAVMFPVLLYLYFNLLLGKGIRTHRGLFIGSGVLFVFICCLSVRYAFMDEVEKGRYIDSLSTDGYPLDLFIYTTVFYAWQLVYFSVITRELSLYKRKIDERISNIELVQFLFARRFIFLLWVFTAVLVLLYLCLPLYTVDYVLLPIVVNILYFFITYFSYHHNAIFTKGSFAELNKVNAEVNKKGLSAETKSEFKPTPKHAKIHELILRLLDEQFLYRDNELNLRALADQVGEPEYLVSQSINYYFKKTFFEVINDYRIKAAKKRLLNFQPTETIEGIAFETGFNNRSSFYRVFKKMTGQTPQEFIESTKKSEIKG